MYVDSTISILYIYIDVSCIFISYPTSLSPPFQTLLPRFHGSTGVLKVVLLEIEDVTLAEKFDVFFEGPLRFIHPEASHLKKIPGPKRTIIVFQPSFFRGELLNFRGEARSRFSGFLQILLHASIQRHEIRPSIDMQQSGSFGWNFWKSDSSKDFLKVALKAFMIAVQMENPSFN